MVIDIADDRLAQLLIKGNPAINIDDARANLDRATIILYADESAKSAWGQAALLTIAECAVRMFRGGVYLGSAFDEPMIVGGKISIPLRQMLLDAGCKSTAPSHAKAIYVGIGNSPHADALRCWADGWVAIVSPRAPSEYPVAGNELSGALAGAMVVSEAFRMVVLRDLRAGKKTHKLSPLSPSAPHPLGISLDSLPSHLWLLGLGNLGQATLWILGLLPYSNPAEVKLVLQDTDVVGAENLSTQILTKPAWIGRKKTRATAEWAEQRGFHTDVIERRFEEMTKRTVSEPSLAFIGVDNVEARRYAANAGFDLVIDAGLGASASEIFDIRLHSFPGQKTPEQAWPDFTPEEKPLNAELARLVKEGRLNVCGAMTIAGQSVGIPSVAVIAAVMQVAQACRAITEGKYCDLVDLNITDAQNNYTSEMEILSPGIISSEKSRNAALATLHQEIKLCA